LIRRFFDAAPPPLSASAAALRRLKASALAAAAAARMAEGGRGCSYAAMPASAGEATAFKDAAAAAFRLPRRRQPCFADMRFTPGARG